MEGEILWKKDHYAIRYFEDGDEHLQSLALGDEIEVFVNDAWKKVKVEAKNGEPVLVGVGYGDGIGCQARFEKK